MNPSAPALPHFSMLHAAVRKEISRLRVSIERSPISSHRHAAPLEMTRRCGSIGSWEKETNSKSTAPPSTCHPERQQRILVHGVSMPDGIKYRSAGRYMSHIWFPFAVISTAAYERWEISPINAACRSEAEDFSAQSFNRMPPISAYRHAAPPK